MILFDKKDFENKLKIALEGIAFDITESLKDKLTKEHGRDTGKLISGITYSIENNTIEITMPEHAKYLEFGTPPHMPPVEELKGWVTRKFGDDEAAWALAMHIKKFGTRPYPFIRNTFNNEMNEIVNKNLREAFKQ